MGGKDGLGAHAAFCDTSCAAVPDYPAPDDGPVYLEGRLVLSRSFQGDQVVMQQVPDAHNALERYRLWDDLAETWHASSLEVLRFEMTDVVVRAGADPVILWEGTVNTQARVVPVPDLDEAGMQTNLECDLCWKRV